MSPPHTHSPESVIQMEHVVVGSMRDGSLTVAKQVNWTVHRGDYWVVAGLQGSGKSDFLMMTGGVIPPKGGQYRLLGEAMPIFDPERLQHRLRLGLVFDGGQLLNHLTVSENISLPLRYHRNLTPAEAEPRVREALWHMELEPWADSTPGALGRNWRKRVGLARALMLQPEILLVDSPLDGLDPRHSNWWLSILAELSKGHPLTGGKPVTLVVTAADLRPWQGQARQFALLQDQRLVTLGDWAQVAAAREQLVRELLNLSASIV